MTSVFICSGVKYTKQALSYALERPDSDWRTLFDVIMCSAEKPKFFDSKKPFRKYLEDVNVPSAIPVGTSLEPGNKAIYVHGSVQALRRATG